MSPAEWDSLPWDEQRMLFEGFIAEGLITRAEETGQQEGAPQFASRAADGGADVIDIQAMIADSKAAMAQKAATG